MGKAFTDEEKMIIHNKLIKVGLDDISKYGFKKTSIDDIAKKVGISKGAFYKFFPSKEVFFFTALESLEKDIKAEAIKIIPRSTTNLREDLVNNFCDYMNDIKVHKFVLLLHCDDLETICRALPDGAMEKHMNKDNDDILDIIKPLEDLVDVKKLDLDFISGMLRVLFLTITHEAQIGEGVINKVIRAQVEIVVDNILKE
ncbi:MAG: TetR/AcrR family transcriptional regulator [Clostridium sp.]